MWNNNIIHGDCLRVLPEIPDAYFDTVYTDPVWPGNSVDEFSNIDPYGLFAEAAAHFARIAKRVIIHLGCNTDPRLLKAIPMRLNFFRVVNLRYARPHYHGRVLYDRDIAYVYGPPPKSRPGNHVISGDYCYTNAGEDRYGHPCPRRTAMVTWLLDHYADGPVLDPFAGVCTAAVSCIKIGLPYCCIEINENYVVSGRRRVKYTKEAGVQLSAFGRAPHPTTGTTRAKEAANPPEADFV